MSQKCRVRSGIRRAFQFRRATPPAVPPPPRLGLPVSTPATPGRNRLAGRYRRFDERNSPMSTVWPKILFCAAEAHWRFFGGLVPPADIAATGEAGRRSASMLDRRACRVGLGSLWGWLLTRPGRPLAEPQPVGTWGVRGARPPGGHRGHRRSWPKVSEHAGPARTPGGIRTHTVGGLSTVSLPLEYRGAAGGTGGNASSKTLAG
jgi:hypothetical protein